MDDTQLSVAVWRPAEQWQVEDKAVDLRLRWYRLRSNGALAGAVRVVVLALVLIALEGRIEALSAWFVIRAAAYLILYVRHQNLVGRWLPTARDLLTGAPSRRVPARIVQHTSNSAVLAVEQMYLRLPTANWGLRQVIARAGEVTLLGPDAKGYAVVLVDGLPAPQPAQVLAVAPAEQPAEPPAHVSVNGADDAVPRWYARRHVRVQFYPLIWLIPALALVYDVTRPLPHLGYRPFAGAAWLYLVVLVAVILLGSLPALDQFRLPKLLAAGQWRAYPVTVGEWKGDPRPFGDLTLRLSLPDEMSLPVRVKHAPVELVANVSATGTLWVIGTPAAGKLTAVGVPGYPIAAPARFV